MSTTDDILKEMDDMEKAEIEKSPARKLQMGGYAKRQNGSTDIKQPAGIKGKLSRIFGGK